MSLSRSLLTLTLLTASAALAAWTQQGAATVTFDAKGPAGFKIHGASEKAVVADDGKNVTVTVKLEDVDTDNGLRNKHMLEDAHASDHPTVTLTVPTASLKDSGDQEATGSLDLNAQKKDVKFTYTAKCEGAVCEIEASAPLNLGDFGIKIRSYLGVTVKPDITVGAKFKVKK